MPIKLNKYHLRTYTSIYKRTFTQPSGGLTFKRISAKTGHDLGRGNPRIVVNVEKRLVVVLTKVIEQGLIFK
jgi:hypothetical protein